MNTVFDPGAEAKNNPHVNVELITATMDFQNFLLRSGIGRKASYRIDSPSDQRNEMCKQSNEQKIVTRIF